MAWLAATQAQPALATTLPPSSLPLHNATAGPADGCPSDGSYWHFVLTPNDGSSSFVSVVLNVVGSTYTFTGFPPIIANAGQSDNVFVPVPSGHAVTDLETEGSYAVYNGGDPTQFVLSGVCAGIGDGTTTTTAAPTTSTDAPTTTQPTTSTTQPTTTTTSCDTEECDTTTTSPTTTRAPTTTVVTPVCTGGAPGCGSQSTTTDAPTTTSTISPVLVQPATATPASPTPTPAVASAQLASTGADTGLLAAAGAGLIALGVGALALGTRRRTPPLQQ